MIPTAVFQLQRAMMDTIAALGWIVLTVLIYAAARVLHARLRYAILNPALVAIVALIVILYLTRTPYASYDRGGHVLSLLLGPAVVALGFPLAQQLPTLRRRSGPIALALLAGALAGIVAGAGVAALLGGSVATVRSLAPRSVTTPIAMAVAAKIGGIPALSALVAIATGIIGGAVGPELLAALGVRSRVAVGLALGSGAHGLGTARAMQEGETEAAAAGVGMALMGFLTAVLAPPIARLLTGR